MRSHLYEFKGGDVLRLVWPSLMPVVVFAVLMHGSAALKLLPRPRPILDVDRTILVHQAEASGLRSDAEVVLIGDSSCLMDVVGSDLSTQAGRSALNLGTLSFLDLNHYALLLRRFAAANPNQTKAVVLLMHPEALRRVPGGTYHPDFFRALLAGSDHFLATSVRDNVLWVLGLETFRGRFVARTVPSPLAGNYGLRYGFSDDLERFMDVHRGTLFEVEPRKFEGNAEYRLVPQLESASRAFRAVVPEGAKLIVATTPAPQGFVRPDYAETHRRMLQQWAGWLKADYVAWELPTTLPDELFARTTHLTEKGARTYTERLSKVIAAQVR